MRPRSTAVTAVLLLAACATHPVRFEVPIELFGVVSGPVNTGWFKDFCHEERLVSELPDCMQVGGEIYRVSLLDARTLEGKTVSPRLVVGFPAHALPKNYRERKRVRLERSPDGFREATGIEYVVSVWSDT